MHTNPADHFMNMMSIEAYEVDEEEGHLLVKRQTDIDQSYKQKIDSMQNDYDNSELKCNHDSEHPEAKPIRKEDNSTYKAGLFKQYCLLLQRAVKNLLRIPMTSYAKIISIFFTALLIILIYGQIGIDARSIQSRNGVLFFITIGAVMNQVQGVILIFPEERPVFLREHGNRMYNSFIYFMAIVTAGIPNIFLFSGLGSILYYFSIQLNSTSAERYFIHFGYHFMLGNAATGLGYIVGAAVEDKRLAVGLLPMVMLPFMLVGGFFVNQNNFVNVLLPFEYLSLFKYGYQVLTINEYRDLDLS